MYGRLCRAEDMLYKTEEQSDNLVTFFVRHLFHDSLRKSISAPLISFHPSSHISILEYMCLPSIYLKYVNLI